MKDFIVNYTNIRETSQGLEFEVEWNDGSIEWVSEEKVKEAKD